MSLKSFIPILEWLPKYNKTLFKGDLSAGLTVGVMLIPQGMAYAMIAGLPPEYGLYACLVPILIYSILGTSRQLAVGPVAMVSLLTATSIGTLADANTSEYIQLALILAFLIGVFQFLLGVFRLGFLVNFLSHPVISGFTSAAALIIGLSQLKHLLGINIPRTHHIHEIILNAIDQFDQINWYTFAIGIVGILIIIAIKRMKRAIPGTLVVVVLGILAVWLLELDGYGVKIVGNIPSKLPGFKMIHFDMDTFKTILPMVLAISFVSFMESIAVAKAIQVKHKDYKVLPNQELIALGIANIFGSMFQSYPTAGGFGRTAVKDQAGAQTGIAGFISAGMIVIALLFLTPLIYFLPKAILASIIMVAVYGLIDFKEVKHLWHSDKQDFVMLMVTFFATLILGVEQGIGVGVVLSLAMVLFKTTRPHTASLAKVPNSHFYRNTERFSELEERDDLLIYRFDAQLFFANIDFFVTKFHEYIAAQKDHLRLVIIDGESINNVDSSAIHALLDIHDDLVKQNIELAFTGIKGPVRDAFNKSKFDEKVGKAHFFMSIQEAVDCYDNQCLTNQKKLHKDYTLQSE